MTMNNPLCWPKMKSKDRDHVDRISRSTFDPSAIWRVNSNRTNNISNRQLRLSLTNNTWFPLSNCESRNRPGHAQYFDRKFSTRAYFSFAKAGTTIADYFMRKAWIQISWTTIIKLQQGLMKHITFTGPNLSIQRYLKNERVMPKYRLQNDRQWHSLLLINNLLLSTT